MRKMRAVLILIVIGLVVGAIFVVKGQGKKSNGQVVVAVRPERGSIQTVISSTGTVLPKNRLEVKPPVNGRIESVLVKEGDQVKAGDVLAWMSSTERAALLDAARGKDEETLKYWQDAYKPIPLPAPIDGQVIVATTQPGQTVMTSDAVIVLSDHLIARAQVDETDIGKVRLDQEAIVTLDAYPDGKIRAKVGHIYYESETINNVTVYKVDLLPEKVPAFFRSGMNASVDFVVEKKDDALLLPVGAVRREKDESYCLVQEGGPEPVKRVLELGMTDDKNYEVLSGLAVSDTVVIMTEKYVLPTASNTGKNPFLPARTSRQGRGGGGPGI